MKILFMGTPEFAKASLEKLYFNNYEISAVITQSDKPQGRKMILTPSPVKIFASEHNIKIYQPESLKTEDFQSLLKDLSPDIIIVVAYGKILPQYVLDFPPLGCINVHGSLLPKYRGASPINAAIENGDKITGITIMYMDNGIDTGDIIKKQEVEIGENETFGELHDRLMYVGAELLHEVLKDIKFYVPRIRQDESKAILTKKIVPHDCKIDWNMTAFMIHNKIRSLSPSPAAYTILGDKKIKIYESKKTDLSADDLEIGQIIIKNKKMYVKTADLLLEILSLQKEGGGKLTAQQFLNGIKIENLYFK